MTNKIAQTATRRAFFYALAAVPASAAAASGVSLPAAVAASNGWQTYTVSDPVAFCQLHLPLPPKSLVLWRSSVLLPGIQYDVINASATGTSTFRLRSLPLVVGDPVSVVSFA